MQKIKFFRESLVEKYGKALQRIPIDLYLSCPHRIHGTGGCTFCPEDGAKARHLKRNIDLKKQVDDGINYVQNRYQASAPYIAYFQSYTNTYGDIETIKGYYEEVLAMADFKIVMIATRPDCLSQTVMDYLIALNQRYEVWVELGVQTANDTTLQRVNRGHDFACAENAILKLHQAGIRTTIHLILGLPGETPETMIATAKKIATLPIQGIKFHQMMVLKKTELANDYHHNPHDFHIKNEYEYGNILSEILHILPESLVVMRLCADTDPEQLIAPHWWMKKGQFLTYFIEQFEQKNPQQLVVTEDGSFTAYHPQFKQHFHSLTGAQSEAITRFVDPVNLTTRAHQESLRILDIGFGLGYNAICAFEILADSNLTHHIDSLEFDARVLPIAQTIHPTFFEPLFTHNVIQKNQTALQLHIGDARNFVKTYHGKKYNIIFLDPFSPDVNPELWTYDFIKLLYTLLTDDGFILTYSTAFPVIGAFLRAGFHLYHTPQFGHKKPGIIACKKLQENQTSFPTLREKDVKIAKHSLAGVVYRDPTLSSNSEVLRARRLKTVERLKSQGVPKWVK